MPRPRRDGSPASAPDKRKLNQFLLSRLKPQARAFVVWDTLQRGLVIRVRPTGAKSWNVIYTRHRRPRWFHLGAVDAIGLADARLLASRIMFAVAEGKDPAAERRALRSKGTFSELAQEFVERYAKKRNKAWMQPDALIRKHALPRLGKLKASEVSREDVKTLFASIKAPQVANQTIAATSKIFNWGIAEGVLTSNPCQLIERNPTKSRERVLSDSEVPQFWAAFDNAGLVAGSALKMILLTGQRPGEVAHMRREHIVDGWWTLPGTRAAITSNTNSTNTSWWPPCTGLAGGTCSVQ